MVVIQPSNDGRERRQLQGGMVNVGCRDVDGLEKSGHEIKTVSSGIEKLLISGNLVSWFVSVGCAIETTKTNFL